MKLIATRHEETPKRHLDISNPEACAELAQRSPWRKLNKTHTKKESNDC